MTKAAIAADSPLTAAAGARIAREGGNAVDIAVAAALWLYSRFTRLGLVVRASAENQKGAIHRARVTKARLMRHCSSPGYRP